MNVQPQPQACLPKELATSQVFLLGRLGYELKRHAIDELEAAGFSMYDYSVLALLAEGACAAQSSIADLLRLDRSQLVGLLDGLEERVLIERRRDPTDRRRHSVTLTAAGEQQLERLRGLVKQIEEEFLAPLDAESRETLYGLLRLLASHHVGRLRAADESAAVAVAS
jgi:MarR family transcriptional regulator, lower aerobic nicotinate degradation pathway regulator